MANLNKVFLIGNLTRDPEIRYLPNGTAVANFSIATNRVFTLQSGEKKKDVCFVRVVVWRKLAELVNQYLTKGKPVFVEGRLQSRSWEDASGQKKSVLEVVAENIQFLGQPKEGATDSHEQEEEPSGAGNTASLDAGEAEEGKEPPF
jgi:single-strand DNA-binding protein